MKKQGPPEPLDEAHFTNLKRKAGMSVAESRAESLQFASNSKKRRTNVVSKPKGKKNSAGTTSTKGKFTNSLPAPKPASKNSKKPAAVPLPASDEELEDDEDSDAADLMNDEFDELSGEDSADGGVGLGDDFLESGSEVYDSEESRYQVG